jgi:CRP-like cAMP-binding protein
MSQQALHRFNAMVHTTRRERGEWIFVLGDVADRVYIVQKGRMKITAVGEDGHEVLHEIVGPGEVFGDTSTMLGIQRTTSAQALEPSVLFEMCRSDFETLLGMYPELSFRLIKSVGLRLKKAEAHLVNVICHDVPRRVKEALIELMGTAFDSHQPIEIRITQQDLANLVGASRQKTSQALKELEDSNVLRLMYGGILLIAPHKLRNDKHDAQRATATGKLTA